MRFKVSVRCIRTLTDCLPRCSTFYEESETYIPRVFPSRGNGGVFSANDTSICEPTNEGHPATKKSTEDWWDKEEAEAHEEDDEINEGIDENSPPRLRSTKKRCRSTACESSFRKRDMKRHHFSSSLISNLKIETSDESNYSKYTSSKTHDVLKFRLVAFYSSSLKRDISDNDKMKIVNERSRMTIIYEQQS